MLCGVALHPWIGRLSPYIPALLFVMLFITFCRISPRDLRFRKLHALMLILQLGLSVAVYLLLCPINKILAQGAMICLLTPPATASPVITGILGGDISYSTSFLFISNLAAAVAAPVFFSAISANELSGQLSFTGSAALIGAKLFPILLLPLLCAWLVRAFSPRLHAWVSAKSAFALYLWACSLAVVTGSTVYFITSQDTPDYRLELSLSIAALIICIITFALGKLLGSLLHEPVSCGQSLGQKNTVLAIWMSLTFLNPLSSVAPAAYVLWQNLFNSWQIWRKQKKN